MRQWHHATSQRAWRATDRALEEFCRKHGIVRLSPFGSALGAAFGPESDVDLLAEFAAGSVPGLLKIAALERELSGLSTDPRAHVALAHAFPIGSKKRVISKIARFVSPHASHFKTSASYQRRLIGATSSATRCHFPHRAH